MAIEWSRRSLLTACAGAALAQDGFPVLDVRKLGAPADGKRLGTREIQAVIDRAAGNRGGVVYFAPGDYLTGTIVLRENVTLYLEAGAVVWGSKDRADYTHPCLIYAENAANIALRGRGAVDGNGQAFWKREGGRWRIGGWRPSRLLQFVDCDNAAIEEVTFRNSPAWTLHPVGCDRMNIRGISIVNGLTPDDHGPNTDGIDPDGCSRMRISDCYIQSGDDCVVLKATQRPGAKGGCRDVTVTNCVLVTRESALKIGSETFGEFYNIVFSNCAIRNAGCGIGLWMRDGGLIDGWTVSNISMTLNDGGQPIYMTAYPRELLTDNGQVVRDTTPLAGTVRNVSISNVIASGDGGIFISGMRERHMEGITLDNIRLRMQGGREKKLHADPPYPFPLWGHRSSPYDVFCRYVDELKLRHVQVTWNSPEKAQWGSAIRCRNVKGLEIDGFTGRQAAGSEAPVIAVNDTADVFIHNCRPSPGAGVFLGAGPGTANVTLMNNDLRNVKAAAALDPSVAAKELFQEANRPPGS